MSITELPPTTAETPPPPHSGIWDVRAAGHDLRLFVEWGPLMQAVLADIENAEKRIWLETFTFEADSAGHLLAEALKAKAREGVDVRVMYDAVGSRGTPNSFFADMAAAGVQVHCFHTLTDVLRNWSLWSLWKIFNRRNHRKLLVVDDRVAYFGGMNMADRGGVTVHDDGTRELSPLGPWRDLHVRLVGPQQEVIVQSLDWMWKKAHHLPDGRGRWPRRKLLKARSDGLFFFDCAPSLKFRRAHRVLCPLIGRARRNITISMAYFIPGGKVIRALLRARRRGVKVRVVLPGKTDVPAVQWAIRHLYARLVKHGIRIYERQDLMLHSKALVIDDQWSVIGSCNLDPRSLQWNFEFLGVIRSRALACTLKKICAYELRHSQRVTEQHTLKRSWFERLLHYVAWRLRGWL